MPTTTIRVDVKIHKSVIEHAKPGDEVEFHVTEDSTIYFSDPAVFGVKEVKASKTKPTTLKVKGNGHTKLLTVAATGSDYDRSSPNEIVVP